MGYGFLLVAQGPAIGRLLSYQEARTTIHAAKPAMMRWTLQLATLTFSSHFAFVVGRLSICTSPNPRNILGPTGILCRCQVFKYPLGQAVTGLTI